MLECNRREFLKKVSAATGALGLCGCDAMGSISGKHADKPNFIIVFTDDQGYADVGCYGAKGFNTPNLDRMAAEGMKFTDFYSAAPICSPSRAALLTGSYPPRVGIPTRTRNSRLASSLALVYGIIVAHTKIASSQLSHR